MGQAAERRGALRLRPIVITILLALTGAMVLAPPGDAGSVPRCAPARDHVLIGNGFGQLYVDSEGINRGLVMACSRTNRYRQTVGATGRPIRNALAISGRLFAYGTKACDDAGCDTVINTSSFDDPARVARTVLALPGGPGGHNLHEIAALRVSRTKALAWIGCRRPENQAGEDPVTRTSAQCLSRRYMRYLYVRPASRADDSQAILIAKGRTIDPKRLTLTTSGRTVKWRQNGRLRVRTFAE